MAVCGCDGLTYADASEAAAAGVSIRSLGCCRPRSDFDEDCDVDADDFAILRACTTGPGVPYAPGALPDGCSLTPDEDDRIAADADADGDVDSEDFGRFQRCFRGPGGSPPLGCDK